MWNDFLVKDTFSFLGGAMMWKIFSPPPLLLCYIFEKCKPYCKWRGSGAAQILSVKLILGCIFQIIDFIWTLAMAHTSSFTGQGLSRSLSLDIFSSSLRIFAVLYYSWNCGWWLRIRVYSISYLRQTPATKLGLYFSLLLPINVDTVDKILLSFYYLVARADRGKMRRRQDKYSPS